ncbi:MAG: transposase, partial [Bacteroidales bacterium]|nr:transposase [Bacteroidales bacterium]
ERLNGSLRRELLNAYIFRTIDEVKQKTYCWMEDYNENRPHKALNYKTPNMMVEEFV